MAAANENKLKELKNIPKKFRQKPLKYMREVKK